MSLIILADRHTTGQLRDRKGIALVMDKPLQVWMPRTLSAQPLCLSPEARLSRSSAALWGDGVCEIELTGKHFYVSQEWRQIFGLHAQDVSLAQVFGERTHKLDIASVKTELEGELGKAATVKQDFHFFEDDSMVHVQLRWQRCKEECREYVVGAAHHSVLSATGLRSQSEDEIHKNLIQQIPVAIALLNKNQEIVEWNNEMEQLTQWSRSQVIGRQFPLADNPIQELFMESVESVSDGSQNSNAFCIDFDTRGREPRSIGVSLSAWRTDDGERAGSIVAFQDFTSYKLSEEKLKIDIAAEVVAGNEFLRRATGHHVRQLLQGLIGNLELLRDERVGSQREFYMAEAIMSARAISDLAMQISTGVGKVNSKKSPHVTFDVRRVLASVQDRAKNEAEKNSIRIDVTVGDDVSRHVRGSASRLTDLLSALTMRIVESVAGGNVCLSCINQPLSGPEVLIFTVEGLGPPARGVDFSATMGLQETRLGADTPPADAGIYACRLIAEELGGLLTTYADENGLGARFEALLPQDVSLSARPLQQATSRHVLVVEDDLLNQTVLRKQLQRLGLECDVVADGLEAWRRIDEAPERYGLILSDCRIPGLSGYELAQRMRQSTNPVLREKPIVAMTGDVMPENEATANDAGMNAYLTKPVGVDRLRATLGQWFPALL